VRVRSERVCARCLPENAARLCSPAARSAALGGRVSGGMWMMHAQALAGPSLRSAAACASLPCSPVSSRHVRPRPRSGSPHPALRPRCCCSRSATALPPLSLPLQPRVLVPLSAPVQCFPCSQPIRAQRPPLLHVPAHQRLQPRADPFVGGMYACSALACFSGTVEACLRSTGARCSALYTLSASSRRAREPATSQTGSARRPQRQPRLQKALPLRCSGRHADGGCSG